MMMMMMIVEVQILQRMLYLVKNISILFQCLYTGYKKKEKEKQEFLN